MTSLREFVAAIEQANPEDEDEFVEWKGTLDLTTTEAAYHVGRAILALANRDPALAGRRFEGCGYVVVGVEPGAHEGVTPIDPAQLAAKVDKFVGGVEGPDWEPCFVDHMGVRVLVVTVEPPRYGDPGYPLRRSNKVNEGTLFHRGKGDSAPATAAEVDMLFERAQASVPLPFDLDARFTPADSIRKLNVSAYVQRMSAGVAERAESLRRAAQLEPDHDEAEDNDAPDELLDPAFVAMFNQSIASSLGNLGISPQEPEERTLDDYLTEVDDYEKRLTTWVEQSVGAAAWQQLDDVFLEVTNKTDTYLREVRVEVVFEDDRIVVLDVEPDTEDEPAEPLVLGERPEGGALFPVVDFALPPSSLPTNSLVSYTTSADGNSIVFDVGSLPPRGIATSEELRIIVPIEVEGEVLRATCTATAADHHRVFQFTVATPIH